MLPRVGRKHAADVTGRDRRHRWQELAAFARSRSGSWSAPSGERMGRGQPPSARTGCHRAEVQRDHGDSAPAGIAGPQRLHRHHRREAGCQTKIAEQIIDAGADYVLALKGNQSTLAEEVEDAFIDADARDYADMEVDVLETVEKGHGRKERRRYTVLGDLRGVSRQSLWKGLDAICMVESEREIDGHTSRECRYYIGSIGANAEQFANAVRAHWTIENSLHWTLDVAFREDESRLRDPSGRENFAVLRHMALARLKNDKSTKTGIKNKRLKAGWNNDYLAKLLMQSPLAAP
jgi:predicted transposase YbfD/YdcC